VFGVFSPVCFELSVPVQVIAVSEMSYYVSVTVKWLAVKTASEMTYTVLGGALNSTQSSPIMCWAEHNKIYWELLNIHI